MALFLVPGSARGQGEDRPYYSRQLAFRIPFHIDPEERRIREVHLHVSQDQGKTWQQVAKAQPGERYFSFQARREGWYWFAVQTIDFQDRAYPANLDQVDPRLKVCVDTQPPAVTLKAAQVAGGPAGVEWDVRDDHLDLESLILEYRVVGSAEWVPVAVDRAAAGQRAWNPGTNAALEVRLQVQDLAGNPGEAKTNVTPAAVAPTGPGAVEPDAAQGNVRIVKDKKITITYKLEDIGKSGISSIQLWYTRDGRNWQKYDEQSNPQPPYSVELSGEGVYGLSLVARNRAGGGQPTPRVGDAPQVWVEVDLTPPVVRLQSVDVGRGAEAGNLSISYTATDKNLARQCINIAYATDAKGPWTTVASNLENLGRYVWKMPEDVPFQFHVRVEAVDKAGNSGTAETGRAVVVDLSQPKVNVISIDVNGPK